MFKKRASKFLGDLPLNILSVFFVSTEISLCVVLSIDMEQHQQQ